MRDAPGRRLSRWPIGLIFVAIVGTACASSAPPSSQGAATDGPGGSGTGDRVEPLSEAPVVGLAALAAQDEWILADGLEVSGGAALLGPGLLAWLADERQAFVDRVLDEGGIETAGRVASIEVLPPTTAVGMGGWMMAVAGSFITSMSRQIGSSGGEPVEIDLTTSEIGETTRDGKRARVSMSITLALESAGSHLGGTIGLSITVTLLGPDGQATGTITISSTSTVDMDVCPDIDGQVNAHFETSTDISSSGGSAGAGTYRVNTSGTASGNVGDDAFLHALRVTGESAMRTTGPQGSRSIDAAVSLDGRYLLSTPGRTGSLSVDPSDNAVNGDVTRDNGQATDREITGLYEEVAGTGVIVASMLFEAAQERWRNGACVRIEATEETRAVDPDESFSFTAKPVHVVEAIDLDAPVVATFSGLTEASPLDVEQDPPASIDFTAGSDPGDEGTITLKSTSKRGIGTLLLTFTVERSGWLYDFQTGLGNEYGLKCDGVAGEWTIEGTAKIGGLSSTSLYVITIDESSMTGRFKYEQIDEISGGGGSGVTIYNRTGTVSLRIDPSGAAIMTLTDTKSTITATILGHSQTTDIPLDTEELIWDDAGDACSPPG